MKLTTQVEHLNDALSKILSVIDYKNPRKILTYALFTAKKKEGIILEATDLEVSNQVFSSGDVEEEGSICVHPKNLYDLTREMPNRPISLETTSDNNLLKITSGPTDVVLLICSPEEFPSFSFKSSEECFELTGKDALYFISKISHAIGHDEARIFLNGIFLQQEGNTLRAVATNGYTFALIEPKKMDTTNKVLSKGIIVPKKGVAELKKIAERNTDKNIKISVDESFMYVSCGEHCKLSIRLIARNYPPYETVIPSKTSYSMSVDRERLVDAIKRVKVLVNEKSNAIRFSMEKEKLTVSAKHPMFGEAAEKLEIDYSGKNIDIGFNVRYIMDSLSVIEDETITFQFNNELSPVILKSEKLKEFLGIVMPLKL